MGAAPDGSASNPRGLARVRMLPACGRHDIPPRDDDVDDARPDAGAPPPTASPSDAGPASPPEWFRDALDSMLDLVGVQRAVRDETGRIVDFEVVYTNEKTPAVAEIAVERLTGARLRDLYPGIEPIIEQYARVVETGEPLSIEEMPYDDDVDGHRVSGWFALQVARFGDGVIVVSRNVSEAVESRRLIEETSRRFEAAQELAHIGIFTLDLATDRVWFSDELRRIFELPPEGPLPSRDELLRLLFDPDERDLIDAMQLEAEASDRGVVFETSVRLGRNHRTLLVHLDRELEDGEVVALWGTAQDVTRLRQLETQRDAAEDRLRGQRQLIDQFQAATLAPVPPVEGLTIEAAYYPASGQGQAHFGGDWYDVFAIDANTVGVAVGDVTGHGIEAVASMAQLRNALRAYAYRAETASDILMLLNDFAVRSDMTQFATVLCGLYTIADHTLRWARAGHPPPVLVDGGGARVLELPGHTPIGIISDPLVLADVETTLEPGSLLVLYTDGLVERRDEIIDVGFGRLQEAAASLAVHPGPICRRLRTLVGTTTAEDDICLLTIRRDA